MKNILKSVLDNGSNAMLFQYITDIDEYVAIFKNVLMMGYGRVSGLLLLH